MARQLIDLIGEKFGKLTVLSLDNTKRKRKERFWNCLCECGNTTVATTNQLHRGKRHSCGCHIERVCEDHGLSSAPEYQIWASMKHRCQHERSYIERNITVCEQWNNSFAQFIVDVGKRPSPKYQLDRIDPTKNYEPNNVRWLEGKANQRNRTNHRLIEFNGEIKCISEWSEITGINRITIRGRIDRGWTVEKALTTPPTTKRLANPERSNSNRRLSIPEYSLWQSLKGRCKHDLNYVTKGISVFPAWADSFDVFYAYLQETIGKRPSKEFELDRIDSLGNYEPGNIRWVTRKENMRNTTNNRLVTYQGKTQTVAAWAEDLKISYQAMLSRLNRMSVDKAMGG